MSTRTEVISSLISKYNKQVTGIIPDDVELAVFKIAICQLVDAAFDGGGGSESSPQIVSDGIDGSIDINSILTRLQSIDTKLLAQSDIVSAIQSATDIDTIIARLTSILTNSIVTSNTYTNAVVTSIGLIFPANTSRKFAVVFNRSVNTLDLFLGSVGVFGAGLPLAPQQSYEINSISLYQGIISLIGSSGTNSSVTIVEGI